MRLLLALALLMHGVAHTVGYLKATGPRWDRVLGLAWLVLAIGFASVSVATAADLSGWNGIALGLAAASTLLCIAKLPETTLGLIANLVVIAVLL